LIFQLLNQCCRRFKCCWRFSEAIVGSLLIASIAVSSANVTTVVLVVVGRSAVYIRYSKGPRTLPCGTPEKQ
jgi:hypothetical protein